MYCSKSSGFYTLWPYQELGKDKAVALYLAGCRAGKIASTAKGWAAVVDDGVKKHVVMLKAVTLTDARACIEKQFLQPVSLFRALWRGRVTVWEKVEVYSPESGEFTLNGHGVVIAKAKKNPRNVEDMRGYIDGLAATVTHELSQKLKPDLLQQLHDWVEQGVIAAETSQKDLTNAMTMLKKKVETELAGSHALAAPSISQEFSVTVNDVADKTKDALTEMHFPNISVAFNQPDMEAINQIGTQAGYWMRDSSGQISQSLSNKSRGIIEQGMKQGLGRMEIADMLVAAFPNMYKAHSNAYAATVASVAVSRARSMSEVASYKTVGIEYLEIMAMLDERTTDICRTLDGMIIEVDKAHAHQIAAANVSDPEDIKKVSPFCQIGKDKKTGDKFVHVAGNKIASIKRSGVGAVHDRGEYDLNMSNKNIIKAGVTMPPFHYRCRSLTLPVTDMVQVPEKYEAHTTMSSGQQMEPESTSQNPIELIPEPKPSMPVSMGSPVNIQPPASQMMVTQSGAVLLKPFNGEMIPPPPADFVPKPKMPKKPKTKPVINTPVKPAKAAALPQEMNIAINSPSDELANQFFGELLMKNDFSIGSIDPFGNTITKIDNVAHLVPNVSSSYTVMKTQVQYTAKNFSGQTIEVSQIFYSKIPDHLKQSIGLAAKNKKMNVVEVSGTPLTVKFPVGGQKVTHDGILKKKKSKVISKPNTSPMIPPVKVAPLSKTPVPSKSVPVSTATAEKTIAAPEFKGMGAKIPASAHINSKGLSQLTVNRMWTASKQKTQHEFVRKNLFTNEMTIREEKLRTQLKIQSKLKANGFEEKLAAAEWMDVKSISQFTEKVMSRWAGDSCDNDELMATLHVAVKEYFGLSDRTLDSMPKGLMERTLGGKFFQPRLDAMKVYVDVVYRETQEALKDKGIKRIYLSRGHSVEKKEWGVPGSYSGISEETTVSLRPLSSYSTDPEVSINFADQYRYGVVFTQEVPADRIFSFNTTGPGTAYETEFVVIGGHNEATIAVTNDNTSNYLKQEYRIEKLFPGWHKK